MSDLIFTRRHPGLASKENIWKLVNKSYKGGDEYRASSNLFRFVREGEQSYKDRIIRSVFENNTQPLADTLAGFPFIEPPKRTFPNKFQYIIDTAYRGRSLDQFSRQVAVQSLLYTTFVLVDSPRYDPQIIKTSADRVSAGLYPYCVMYEPFKIRDFYVDDRGKLTWILLDDSYCDSSNPKIKPVDVVRYRLWETDGFTDYQKTDKDIYESTKIFTNFNEIPGAFVLWKDIDDDLISDSPFEDIALIDRQNYNYDSLQDELITNAVFRALFYPVSGSDGIPNELKTGELASLLAIPYDGSLSGKPFFDGPDISDVEIVDKKKNSNRQKQRAKIGIDEEMQKVFAQSGYAKSLDFMKTKSLITMGKNAIESMERDIIYFASLWEGQSVNKEEIKIEYNIDFDSSKAEQRFAQLLSAYEGIKNESIKKEASKEIAKILFPKLDQDKLKKIMDEIENTQTTVSTIGAMMQ